MAVLRIVVGLLAAASTNAVRNGLRATPVATSAHVVPQSFAHATAQATSKAVPVLQPADVYDADYPSDMAEKTPQELRYAAQADYAKAVARLKKELAEAEAARRAMEAELKDLEEAKRAAAEAEARAKTAAQEAEALRKKLGKEASVANKAAKSADAAKDGISKEQSELDAASKAFKDAQAAEEAAKAKIEALRKKHEDLKAEIAKLEKDQAGAKAGVKDAHGEIGEKKLAAQSAEQDVKSAEARAKLEAAEAAKAEKEAADAKAKLAAAEAAHTKAKDPEALKAEMEKLRKQYEMAKETHTKEANDVIAAQRRVDQAKAELAKWEPKSSAKAALPALASLALMFFISC